ncbi:GH3 auxin-responsive promoter [Pisolithus microcarpus]|nr:GH3 auxin-responsive promoter [Pisolithus microcarpus]
MSTSTVCPLSSLSSELKAALQERTEHRLRIIAAANITTHYGISAASLSPFRQVITGKNVKEDPTIIEDFRRVVPVTDYESYSPFVAKSFSHPCKQSELENLLAPGLPSFIGISSSTTRNKSKLFAKYSRGWSNTPPTFAKLLQSAESEKTAYIYCFGYRELLEVMGEDGEIMKKIPVCIGTCGGTDSTRMGAIMPGHVSPWATGFITHHRSFLLIHELFVLSESALERFIMTFLTFFVDLIHHIQAHWDMFITSVRDGTIPDIEHIDHIRTYLQVNSRANPQRAEELQSIGPPLTCSTWARRVWPNLKTLVCICSGTFATAMPKTRWTLGQNVFIQNVGYGCTECLMGRMLDVDDTEACVFDTGDVIEFLDISEAVVHDNILQAVRFSTPSCSPATNPLLPEDGLWRYLIDDIIQVTGFHPRSGSPVFKFYGRKNLAIRLPYAAITEAHLVSVVRAIDTEDIVKVQEFTAIIDQRELPQTVGFFFETTGDTGRLAKFGRRNAFEALVATNEEHQRAFDTGRLRLPTIRIVRRGTFAEYRLWRAESMKAGIGQIKAPVAMSNEDQQEWITERVVMEL